MPNHSLIPIKTLATKLFQLGKEFWADFLNILFPETCPGCNKVLLKQEDCICLICLHNLPQFSDITFGQARMQLAVSDLTNLQYSLAMMAFGKKNLAQKIIHEIKYKNNPALGLLMGRIMGEALITQGLHSQFDIMVPVPLHPDRQKQRGYNQAELFCKGLNQVTGLPFNINILTKIRKTETQTRKGKLARRSNLKDTFMVSDYPNLTGKRILLIDDVFTTGATLATCASALIIAAPHSVSTYCLAYTLLD